MRTLLLPLGILIAALSGCVDRTTTGATIGFVELRGVGGSWPFLIERGDSAAFYSEALHRGWAGPAISFSSLDRPERFRWHSSDSTVLSLDGRGVARAHAEGQATLWAEVDEMKSTEWSLTVIPAGMESFRLEVMSPPDSTAAVRVRVTAHTADGRALAGIPFLASLRQAGASPPLRCTPGTRNTTPCELAVDLTGVSGSVSVHVLLQTVQGRSDDIEAEIALRQ